MEDQCSLTCICGCDADIMVVHVVFQKIQDQKHKYNLEWPYIFLRTVVVC